MKDEDLEPVAIADGLLARMAAERPGKLTEVEHRHLLDKARETPGQGDRGDAGDGRRRGTRGWPATSATPSSARTPEAHGWPRNAATHPGGSTPRWPPLWPMIGLRRWPASSGTASTSSCYWTHGWTYR